jgi:hypothetical protein
LCFNQIKIVTKDKNLKLAFHKALHRKNSRKIPLKTSFLCELCASAVGCGKPFGLRFSVNREVELNARNAAVIWNHKKMAGFWGLAVLANWG